MSANDSEHFARESRSPPGTPCQKTHPSHKRGGFFIWLSHKFCPFSGEFIARTSLIFADGLVEFGVAGLLALLGREPGQVRKEAAPATEASAGGRARHLLILQILYELPGPRAQVAPEII